VEGIFVIFCKALHGAGGQRDNAAGQGGQVEMAGVKESCYQASRYQVIRMMADEGDEDEEQGGVRHEGAGAVAEVLGTVAILLTLLLAVLVRVARLEVRLLGGTASTSHFSTLVISGVAGAKSVYLLAYLGVTAFWSREASQGPLWHDVRAGGPHDDSDHNR